MANITEVKAIVLLKKYAPDEHVCDIVLRHVKAVEKVATRIALQCKNVDLEFVKTAALLHDIGRFKTGKGKHGINHGIIGAEILRNEGLDERYALVCERHIGVGIRKKDVVEQKLPLPEQDFVPETNEEKIIAYADNLAEGKECRIVEEKDIVERYRKELGEEHAKRVIKFHDDINQRLKH